MAVSFECPSCERKLKAPEKLIGKRLQCPSCFNEVTVPGGSSLDAYPPDSEDPMPSASRRSSSNSPKSRSGEKRAPSTQPEDQRAAAWYQSTAFVGVLSGFGGFLLGVFVMWLAGRNSSPLEDVVSQSAPAPSASAPSTAQGTPDLVAEAPAVIATEAGYGSDLPQVIDSAIKDLESGQVRQFVLRIFPPEAIVEMQAGPVGQSRLDSINPESTLVLRMREDLKVLKSVTPEMQGDTAEFVLPPQQYSAADTVLIRPNPKGLEPPDRVVRFSLSNGHWRFYAGAKSKQTGGTK